MSNKVIRLSTCTEKALYCYLPLRSVLLNGMVSRTQLMMHAYRVGVGVTP